MSKGIHEPCTVAIMMVRDEADIIEGTLRHLADEVDYTLVADNGSTDGTREILDRLAGDLPLLVTDDPVVAYTQGEKMSALAGRAYDEMGATWVIPADADELWVSPLGRIGDVLAAAVNIHIAEAALYNHVRTGDDLDDPDPFRAMRWRRRDPGGLPKVAFRYRDGARVTQGNHSVELPDDGQPAVRAKHLLTVHHYPIRSADQMVSKARNGADAYAAAPDLPEDWGNHWRSWGRILAARGPEAIHEAYQAYWYDLSPVDAGLVLDQAPYRRHSR